MENYRKVGFSDSRVVTMGDRYSNLLVNRIISLCKARGLTIYQLSQMSGVSYSSLDNIMNKHTFDPRIKTLHKIATAFSLTVAEFLDFDALNNYSFDDESEDD